MSFPSLTTPPTIGSRVDTAMSLPVDMTKSAVDDLCALTSAVPATWTGRTHERFLTELNGCVSLGMDLRESVRLDWSRTRSELLP
ncbi:hypothetical protein [uncultured Bifidobacterium sp.]|uniref:hypothetical protein n=1 Tax=uncultured Bifidobacterium sp. TaxID=165187 RepID=UPI00261AFF8E|nr:hypothetical protein [uncultured Bifidobacterium sp.]